jgi:hypothetical protein
MVLVPEQVLRGIFRPVAAASNSPADIADLLVPTLFYQLGFASYEDGQLLLGAQIALAAGQVRRVAATMDSVQVLNPRRAREFRGVFGLLPLPDAGDASRRAAFDALGAPLDAAELPRLGEPLRHYLRGALSVRLRDTVAAAREVAVLEHLPPSELDSASLFAKWFARLIRAEVAKGSGQAERALALLGAPHALADHRLPYVWSYPLAHERFLRAELLASLGRTDDALRWYATFPDPNAYDFMFVPAARFRTAELLERAGQRERAAAAYERFSALWAKADPSLQSFVKDAGARAQRLRASADKPATR